MNLPTTGRIKETGATYLEKLMQWDINIIFDKPLR